jgi:hypothetical protein
MGVKISLVLCSSPSFDRCEKRTITFSVRVYDIWRDSAVSEERSVEHLQCSSLTKIGLYEEFEIHSARTNMSNLDRVLDGWCFCSVDARQMLNSRR